MKEKTTLFITYIEFFHKLHTKYLKRFTVKIQLMSSQINNDIKLDNPNDTEATKKAILNDFKENNIDKSTLRQLKISVYDENSNISSDQSKTPESRKSSNSNAPEPFHKSNLFIKMNDTSNMPISNNISSNTNLHDTNIKLYEDDNNFEQITKLSDDICEIDPEPQHTLDNEESSEDTIKDEDSSNMNNISFQTVDDCDRIKKKKKKKKKN